MKLYAIPTPLGGAVAASLPAPAIEQVRSIRDFAVENAKSARAFLKECGLSPRELGIVEVASAAPEALLAPLCEGRPLGLLSEAGCPAIADPGARVVEAAHAAGFRVVPLVGPSSIVLALMGSGLEGQRFAFHGYLPREKPELQRRLKELERRSRAERQTQIFIETPYRSDAMLEAIREACADATRLCVAADLTLPGESIETRPVAEWRRRGGAVGRRPAVFLFEAR